MTLWDNCGFNRLTKYINCFYTTRTDYLTIDKQSNKVLIAKLIINVAYASSRYSAFETSCVVERYSNTQ